MNRELKFFDTALSFAFDTTAESAVSGVTGRLDLIPQNVTESGRVGRKCVIKSIQIRGRMAFTPGGSANAATETIMYLIQDKQANGAQAAFTDIFTNAVVHTGMFNLANSQRFKILKKWVQCHNSQAGVTTAFNSVVDAIEYFKLCNIPLEFSGTTGAITELRSNHLFLAYGSSDSDDLVTFDGTCRLKFED